MKKFLISLLIVVLGLCMFTGCGLFNRSEEEDADLGELEDLEYDESYFDEMDEGQLEDEDESSDFKTKKVDDSFFIGSWVARSEKAYYMYGNVEITINKDGTWDGNITEEQIHGRWTRQGGGIRLTSDVIPFNMVYSSNNNVILQETDDAVRVVLTRK